MYYTVATTVRQVKLSCSTLTVARRRGAALARRARRSSARPWLHDHHARLARSSPRRLSGSLIPARSGARHGTVVSAGSRDRVSRYSAAVPADRDSWLIFLGGGEGAAGRWLPAVTKAGQTALGTR